MRVKWTTENDQAMRQLVDENKAKPVATKIRIMTRSGENAWYRALAMKCAWTDEDAWDRTRDEVSVGADESSIGTDDK